MKAAWDKDYKESSFLTFPPPCLILGRNLWDSWFTPFTPIDAGVVWIMIILLLFLAALFLILTCGSYSLWTSTFFVRRFSLWYNLLAYPSPYSLSWLVDFVSMLFSILGSIDLSGYATTLLNGCFKIDAYITILGIYLYGDCSSVEWLSSLTVIMFDRCGSY